MKAKQSFMWMKIQFINKLTIVYNLNEAVLTFFKQARNQNLPLSDDLIKEKVKELAEKLSNSFFCARNGQQSKFIICHNQCFKRICDENEEVDEVDVAAW